MSLIGYDYGKQNLSKPEIPYPVDKCQNCQNGYTKGALGSSSVKEIRLSTHMAKMVPKGP